MKGLSRVAAVVCLAMPMTLRAQGMESMVSVGNRVRVAVTDTVLPSPDTRPGRLRQVIGTVLGIAPDTIYLQPAPNDPPVAIPRILIYKVEASLGSDRVGSAGDAALIGGGMGALLIGFVREKLKMPIFAAGYALGALVGAVRPYERWKEAWIPE